MVSLDKYDFSFTASSLRLSEMRLVASHQLNRTKIDYVNELGNGNSATGKRMLAEFKKRLATLSDREIQLLIESDLTSQKQIAFLSVCKAHPFIRDFVVEVLREKLLIFDHELTDGEYISFYRRKNEVHSEMDSLTSVTQKKVRQVTLKILEQAGIIDDINLKQIQPQILSEKVVQAIAHQDSQWLKIFFMSDLDIENTVL